MGKPNASVYSPSVASTMRSAVTALLSFVALPAIPLSSTLDALVELVQDIMNVSNTSRRQVLLDFGKHVSGVVNELVSGLRNERLSQQPNVMRNLEELQRTLDKILRNLYSMNSCGSILSRLGRALFPEEDQMQVARMRRQLDDAMRLFQFAATCELLARTQNTLHDQSVNGHMSTQQQDTQSPFNGIAHDLFQCQEHADHSESTQILRENPPPRNQRPIGRPRRSAFVAAGPPNLEHDEVAEAYAEVKSLRRLFSRSRRPLPAMQLAMALGRYSDLLLKSDRTAEALEASQESAKLFKSLAERGPEVYYDSD
ncbi:hypothetical protein RSOLAG22IIIB_05747 [Rhizoctonia solani]|uniref:Uncharacterized protein n=1 Tax=Rhizoctonia solani TaxID=456999 RepID=A0A0K6G8M9_9AGAM|nr:hypothetical protein RSOLAG22IIIB_05747 [Rhizoctonia solani]